jgi:hypothetical protein
MKKLLINISGLLFITSMFIGINVYKNSSSINNLLLKNVEALTENENEYTKCESGGGHCELWIDDRCIWTSDKHHPA